MATAEPSDGVSSLWERSGQCFAGWLDGDESALAELVAVMTPVLWQVVRAYRLPTDQAEDVIQTTWLALVRRRASVVDPRAVGGWLTTTARREAWRVSSRARRDVPVADEQLNLRIPDQRSAELSAVEADEARRLWRAVGTLSERCQRLLRIVAFEERPDYARIANDLQMPVGSIGPTRGRCLDKLRRAITEEVSP